MSTAQLAVSWGAERSQVAVVSTEHLDHVLDQVNEFARSTGLPQAVDLERPTGEGILSVVIGAPVSLCTHTPADHNPPYLISVGENDNDEPFVFYVDGDHYTECALRNTIDPELAREGARHFLLTGRLDSRISWEET
jgi:hypothetical protein